MGRKIHGRDYHYGPAGTTEHDGAKPNCFYPDCDMGHHEVSLLVRRWLIEANAISIVRSTHTTWHNGSRRTYLYPQAGRERELRALVEDRTLARKAGLVVWAESGHVEIYH